MAKRLLITGASTGIGAETARLAVENGWRIALTARSVDKLEALATELGGPDKAIAIACDVSDASSVAAAVGEAAGQWGGLDAIFANAGIGATAAGTENGDPANWQDMITTNCFGVAVTAKYAIPELKKTKGHLMITGSNAGRTNYGGSIYGATKWFVRGYVGNLRDELQGTGVRVTNIEPGMVDTPFFDEPKPQGLRVGDVARAAVYALEQPATVQVCDMLIVPMPQI